MRQAGAIKNVPKPVDGSERANSVRRIIYERATDLFLEKGFTKTSMNEIAAACGVSKPAIYHYFRNKSDLLSTLYADVTQDFFKAVEVIAFDCGSAEERLRRLVHHQTIYNIEHHRFLTIFWRERHLIEEEDRRKLAALERNFEGWVRRVLEEGKANKEFHVSGINSTAYGILGMLASVHRWARYADSSAEEIADDLADMIVGGLLARTPDEMGKAAITE